MRTLMNIVQIASAIFFPELTMEDTTLFDVCD